MKTFRLFVLAALAALVLPVGALAQDAAPPGNSAVEQYRESAPPAGAGAKKLSESRRRALERRGSDGAALAAALDRNGGVPTGGAGSESSSAGTEGAGESQDGSAASQNRSSASQRDRARPGGDASAFAEAPATGVDAQTSPPGESEPDAAAQESATKAAASSTVGPLPVWAMLVGALVIVGLGLVLRRRASV